MAARRLTSGTTAAGGRGAEGWSPPPCRRRGRRRRPGGRGEGGVPSMPPRRATTLRAPCALDVAGVPLARPVDICDGWRVGEVPERPKGHAWRACVPTRYRGFESLPLRLSKLVWGPVQCSPRVARLRASDAPRPRRPARALSRSASHSSGGPSSVRRAPRGCGPTHARLPPRAARRRRLAWHLSAPASLCLAPPVQGGYCTACPAGVGRWRLGPAQEGVANPVRSGRKQRYRMSSCAAGRPSRYRRTPRVSTQ